MNFSVSKKECALFLSIMVFFLLSSISCSKNTQSNKCEVIFDSIQIDKTHSVHFKNSKLNCNLHIAFTYPVACNNNSLLKDLQRIFNDKVFKDQEIINLPPKEAADIFSEQYISKFQSIKFDGFFGENNYWEDENSFIYELRLENKILYNKNNLISFTVNNTNYEGGAHGSNSIYGCVINLNTGKILTEDEFAGINYKKNLSSIIVQKIAASKGLSNGSQLENIGYEAIEDIVPNDNFIIDDKGITYFFNEYEIAAYFVGITEVFLSYEELKPYITNNNPISTLAGL